VIAGSREFGDLEGGQAGRVGDRLDRDEAVLADGAQAASPTSAAAR
jgi:hypothetical protein